MKAIVYFVELSEDQRRDLNRGGWASRIGSAFLAARDGILTDDARALFKVAAELESENAEEVWHRLQNLEGRWLEDHRIECKTSSPRSMDVGDIIVWPHKAERCTHVGFQPILFQPA
jgi:hypothetical protein